MKNTIKLLSILILFLTLNACKSDDKDDPIEENSCMELVDVHDLVKGATQMYFLNASEGWMIGNDGETFMSNLQLLHTTDGGQSWSIINDNLEIGCCFADFKFQFIDSNNGYMSTINGNYYYTTDGGVTWNTISLNLNLDDFDFYGMGVNNSNMVFAAKTFINGANENRLYFVSNTTHSITNYVVVPNDTYSGFHAHDIHITDSGIINMQVGDGNRKMEYSNNNGETWTISEIEFPAADHSYMQFVNDNIGYLTAQNGNMSETQPFYKTVDGGATWVEKTINADIGLAFTNFAFADENNGLATRFLGKGIYKTTDGGNTWLNVSCTDDEDFNKIHKFSRIAYPSIDNGILLSTWLDIDAEETIDETRNRVYFYKGE